MASGKSRVLHHRSQHWVPRAYLKAWCDPVTPSTQEPYVWRFSKDGETVKRKAPKTMFTKTDMYTVHLADGTRDLTVEHGLAGLEDAFVHVRDDKLAKRRPLSSDDHLLLRAFIAAMQARTRAQLDHWQGFWKDALEMMGAVAESIAIRRPARRRLPPSMKSTVSFDHGEVKELAEGAVGPVVISLVQSQLPVLARMNLTVVITSDDTGFITSDTPCVWFDPEAYKRPALYQAPGLLYDTIEITLPASPSLMLVLTWRALPEYFDITPAATDELNRRTRFQCDEYFVVRRNTKRAKWFDPGTPPPGATDT